MRYIHSIILILCMTMLSGCLYPEEKLKQNAIPYTDQLQIVQSAVDAFVKENNGILPIKTRDMQTPIYQKYPIEFSKLTPLFLQEPPSNAYESGGVYQYVLIDVETKPIVKLIDLHITETIRDVKLKMQMYRDTHQYPPFQEVIANGVYTLDYKKLGYEEDPYVVSPYSREMLPLIIDSQGEIYVDYRIDLYRALQKYEGEVEEGVDVRFLLMKDSPFAPAYSLPYTIQDKDPVFFMQ